MDGVLIIPFIYSKRNFQELNLKTMLVCLLPKISCLYISLFGNARLWLHRWTSEGPWVTWNCIPSCVSMHLRTSIIPVISQRSIVPIKSWEPSLPVKSLSRQSVLSWKGTGQKAWIFEITSWGSFQQLSLQKCLWIARDAQEQWFSSLIEWD